MAETTEKTGEAAAPAVPAAPAAPVDKSAPKMSAPADGTVPEAKEQTETRAAGRAESGAGQTGSKQQGNYHMIFIMVGVVLLFYFMIMRPQKKREQQRKDMLGKIKTGDKVITAAGIVGEIVELTETDAVIKIDPRKDVRMRVRRAALAGPAGDSSSEETVSGSSS